MMPARTTRDVPPRRALRHVVEIPVPAEGLGPRFSEMTGWCQCRFGEQSWANEIRSEGQHRFAHFRFREPAMADQFAEEFRASCPVRCRG